MTTIGGKALGVAMSKMQFEELEVTGALTVGGTASQGAISATSLTVSATVAVGTTASSKFGVHGATPVVQSSAATTVSTTAPVSGAFGYETSAQAIAILTAVNLIITCLKNHGLMA